MIVLFSAFAGAFLGTLAAYAITFWLTRPPQALIESSKIINDTVREREDDASFQEFKEQTESW